MNKQEIPEKPNTKTYMQWAAVRTQQDVMRIPPHKWPNSSVEPLVLTCRDTCQGWAPGNDLLPPKILLVATGRDMPHWENWAESVTDVTSGVVDGADVESEDHWKSVAQHSVSKQDIYIYTVCVYLRSPSEHFLILQCSHSSLPSFFIKHQGLSSPSGFLKCRIE